MNLYSLKLDRDKMTLRLQRSETPGMSVGKWIIGLNEAKLLTDLHIMGPCMKNQI